MLKIITIFYRLFALRTWFLERNNFTYDFNNNELRVVGHYTQMIWASTHKGMKIAINILINKFL